jgi:ribosomal protein S19
MKIYRKNEKIPKSWLGKKLYIYNGKLFQKKLVNFGMVGHKIGEFVLTKKLGSIIHKKEGKKKKKSRK